MDKANHAAAQRWWRTLGDDVTVAEAQARVDRLAIKMDDRRRVRDGERTTVGALAGIREQWERARKVNIAGEQLAADTGPLADAVWMKNNLARAKMALPNGYCALPLQQKCEFANACLTCPVFVTTPEFLPQRRRQPEQTQALIAQADQNGHQRMAEMNRTVEKNLLAIIDGLTATTGCCGNATSCACSRTEDSNAC